jgi:rhodanese-related sulfurtransferase
VQPEELSNRLGEVQVVDVRAPHEWDAGRIDGSVHIQLDDIDGRLGQLDSALPIVAVCHSGMRSAQAAERLRDQGFDARNLEGGLVAWADAGLPLIGPDGGPGTVADPDPEGGDSEAGPGFQAAVVELALEVQDHFGDREPSEADVRGYLRDRMIREGHSPEEADEVLARLAAQDPRPAD